MTLPSSGTITATQVLTELGRPGGTLTLAPTTDADVLTLIGKTQGQTIYFPADFYGKSKGPIWSPIGYLHAETFPSGEGGAVVDRAITGLGAGNTCTLRWSVINGSYGGGNGADLKSFIQLRKNNAFYATFAEVQLGVFTGHTVDMVVQDGDTVGMSSNGTNAYTITAGWQVVNLSGGGAVLEVNTADVTF